MGTTRVIIAALAVMFASQSAWGQAGRITPYQQPYINPRPTVSPFIRLRDGGATTYYGQIRPQIQNTRNIYDLQQQFGMFEQAQQQYGYGGQEPTTGVVLSITGHPVRFFDNSFFFSRTGAGATSPLRTGTVGNAGNTAPYIPAGGTGILRGY